MIPPPPPPPPAAAVIVLLALLRPSKEADAILRISLLFVDDELEEADEEAKEDLGLDFFLRDRFAGSSPTVNLLNVSSSGSSSSSSSASALDEAVGAFSRLTPPWALTTRSDAEMRFRNARDGVEGALPILPVFIVDGEAEVEESEEEEDE